MKNKRKVYLIGGMLKAGEQKQRIEEATRLRELGYEVYNACEQKDINDKKNQTIESNNNLAERIVAKDMKAIRESSLIVAEVDNDTVGSTAEIGAIMEFNWVYDEMYKIIEDKEYTPEDKIRAIKEFYCRYPKKEVHCHTTDIRHTNIPEVGMRRAYSVNAFLCGCVLALNPKGIITFDEILEELKEKQNEKDTNK